MKNNTWEYFEEKMDEIKQAFFSDFCYRMRKDFGNDDSESSEPWGAPWLYRKDYMEILALGPDEYYDLCLDEIKASAQIELLDGFYFQSLEKKLDKI